MTFQVTQTTTPEQAIDMAYELGTSLRATGWPRSREQYARDLWVDYEFKDDPLRPFLDAGFTAGYTGRRKPSSKDFH
ncbi:MAG: hypothetical protein LCH56_03980 [Proteobacteria bacterium]|nr:hypothetical protein [Pseudomonadota bacterium]